MMTYSKSNKGSAEETVREIRRASHRNCSSEEQIRIVLEDLRGEESMLPPATIQPQ
jgi:transposase